jgi:hypothetical protein
MKTYGGVAPPFLTSTLDGDEWSASLPGRFTLEERAPRTHCIGGWVGPRAGLGAVEKRSICCPFRESRTPAVQSVARRYAHWVIPALAPCYQAYSGNEAVRERLALFAKGNAEWQGARDSNAAGLIHKGSQWPTGAVSCNQEKRGFSLVNGGRLARRTKQNWL